MGAEACGQNRQMDVAVTAKEDQGSATVLLEVGSYSFDPNASGAWGLKAFAATTALTVVSATLF